jgi:hypothetical protein
VIRDGEIVGRIYRSEGRALALDDQVVGTATRP